MKRFTVPCDFNGVKHPFHVYIGEPHPKKHPLQFQSWWLSSERGGNIPQARQLYQKALAIDPKNGSALLGAARMEDREGHLDVAVMLYHANHTWLSGGFLGVAEVAESGALVPRRLVSTEPAKA